MQTSKNKLNPSIEVPKLQSFDISLTRACEKYCVNRVVAMGWLRARKKSLRFEKRRLPSGRLGIWVNRRQFLAKKRAGRLKTHASGNFFHNCRGQGADPKKTLYALLTTKSVGRDGTTFYDADLCRAAIKLILGGTSHFLNYLTTAKPLDRSFESELARLLQPDRGFSDDGSDQSLATFTEFWSLCRREVQQGWGTTIPGPLVANRDFLQDGRPEYLNRINCPNIPNWAFKSIVPFRVPEKTKVSSALRRMERLASGKPFLQSHLLTVVASIRDLKPRKPTKEESTISSDPIVKANISKLTTQLAEAPFLVPERDAYDYCWALFTRIHRDTRNEIKRMLAGRSVEGRWGIALPRAGANRIFNMSRGAKF